MDRILNRLLNMLPPTWSLGLVLWLFLLSSSLTAGGRLSLTILHTNDVHSRFDQANAFGGRCPDRDARAGKCYGGMARLMTKVREIRNQDKNTLLLNGGDYYQGTLFFTEYNWKITADFTSRIKYDAVSLGNHEFDNSVDGLIPFLNNVPFPVLACNLDLSKEPVLQKKIKCSHVFDIDGEKVAVMGYLTPETKELSSTGEIRFLDEVDSLQAEADRLKASGVDKIIAVGHSGYPKDKEIARKVKGVDIVVGGHTNTFLYTGTPPTKDEEVMGPYPTVEVQDDGTKVPVVQDYAFAKYLGYLKVEFGEDGHVESWSGNPILLDQSVEMDPETLAALAPYKEGVERKGAAVVGRTYVLLRGDRQTCRLRECNLGNFLADACAQYYVKGPLEEGYWNKFNIAIWNSGGIRSSIDEKLNEGNITMEDVLTLAPFGNSIDIVRLYGRDLYMVMEKSVEDYDASAEDPPGAFLQVSGLQVTYDLNKAPGSRVVELKALCGKCRVPKYLDVDRSDLYDVIVPTYLLRGGDGYKVIKDLSVNISRTGELDIDVILKHIRRMSPVTTSEDRRIRFVTSDNKPKSAETCKPSSAAPLHNPYSKMTTAAPDFTTVLSLVMFRLF